MNARHRLVLLGALLAIGCSDSTAPARLNGTWASPFTVPGNGLQFTLATAGDVVTGDGSWTGEACCSGTVQIAGTSTGGDVSLDFTYTTTAGAPLPTRTAHFEGRLMDVNTLAGTTNGDQTTTTIYQRVR